MATNPLMKHASWAIWSGSGGIPTVRRAAVAFWLAGAAMLLAWVLGLWHEALTWGGSPLLLMSGLSVAVVWCWLACSTWSAWCADRAQLTLIWTGPVREDQGDAAGEVTRTGGFRLAQWDAAVKVEVMLDLQRWMLLRVRTTGGASRASWLWLETSPRGPLHQLRTLVYLSPRLTVNDESAVARTAGTRSRLRHAVASWAHSFNSGSKLRSPVTKPSTAPGRRPLSLSSESAFPSTLVMREDDLLAPHASSRAGEGA
ncbi:MAG: hypothetical protein HYX44_05920 [Aquabacterium sp.]|nr:hypothetical protein [Aquabacterium sp.]